MIGPAWNRQAAIEIKFSAVSPELVGLAVCGCVLPLESLLFCLVANLSPSV